MKKLTVLVSIALICLGPGVSYAQSDNSLREVVVDAMYGGVVGALIGTATMAFADKPSDHKENIEVGAGVGVILGSIYGTVRVSKSFVELNKGAMTVQFPSISVDPIASHERGVLFVKIPLVSLSD